MNKFNKATLTGGLMAAAGGIAAAAGMPWYVHAAALLVCGFLASMAHPDGR